MGRQQPLLLLRFLDLHKRPLSLMRCAAQHLLVTNHWSNFSTGPPRRESHHVNYIEFFIIGYAPDPRVGMFSVLSGFHTSDLPTLSFRTSAHLICCPNLGLHSSSSSGSSELCCLQSLCALLQLYCCVQSVKPCCEISPLGVILSVLFTELLEFLQHLTPFFDLMHLPSHLGLGFECFVSQPYHT